ncbi:unnamed protein product [Prorocentrum cordatum]|uniref:Uncharacterized protein n=1 Tax=Prorocentrum cordatum TaxID=2364126 RepID=A0ABN9QX29_9DINO|nr:unnamed protein product [Polarella glacialis]
MKRRLPPMLPGQQPRVVATGALGVGRRRLLGSELPPAFGNSGFRGSLHARLDKALAVGFEAASSLVEMRSGTSGTSSGACLRSGGVGRRGGAPRAAGPVSGGEVGLDTRPGAAAPDSGAEVREIQEVYSVDDWEAHEGKRPHEGTKALPRGKRIPAAVLEELTREAPADPRSQEFTCVQPAGRRCESHAARG